MPTSELPTSSATCSEVLGDTKLMEMLADAEAGSYEPSSGSAPVSDKVSIIFIIYIYLLSTTHIISFRIPVSMHSPSTSSTINPLPPFLRTMVPLLLPCLPHLLLLLLCPLQFPLRRRLVAALTTLVMSTRPPFWLPWTSTHTVRHMVRSVRHGTWYITGFVSLVFS